MCKEKKMLRVLPGLVKVDINHHVYFLKKVKQPSTKGEVV